ncbi:MAG TPA: HupE/UreJ family protein [Polyangiaceae bacterium]|jgi:hypothetical protein|nr:HupE/UreJ family protein [Polyangiaceae bacterium]
MVALATTSLAHQVGLSRGEYSIDGDHVAGKLTFARNELANLPAAGEKGIVAPASAAALDATAKAIADATHVTMAGAPCSARVESVRPVAPDGIELALEHDCPKGGDVSFRYDFLDTLEPGHRHIAEITTGGRVTTFVAYRGNTSFDVAQAAIRHDAHPLFGFLRLGIEHVLTGWDHLAFLLGVALASFGARRSAGKKDDESVLALVRPLALAVTAFTVAHSITLAAGVFGLVFASPAWVEPLIALSIAYVGLENVVRRRPTAPYKMTFAFGLVHGMGFAGALRGIAVPRAELPGALALFNVGVEVGQLVALVPVVLALTWLARRPALLSRAVRGVSLALAAVGAVVFVTRTLTSVKDARAGATARAANVAAAATPAAPAAAVDRATKPGVLPPSPDVERLCRALNELPRTRRAECEHGKPGVILATSCMRKLESSVSSGALSLSTAEVTACVADVSRRYETCDFVAERAAPAVEACEHVLHGNRDEGQSCRSSLECRRGAFCDGAGPLDAGVCHPPKADGATCGLAIDPLASYVQSATADEHRECENDCVQYRCRKAPGPVARR